MTRIFYFVFLTAALASNTFAANQDIRLNHRPWLFVGADIGYVRMNTDVATEFDKNGYQLALKFLGSYYWPKWVVDAGLGWSYQYLTGAEAPVASENITTRALFVETGGRYRFGDRWQAGAIFRPVFGTDLKFGSNTDSTSMGLFSGAQAVYEIPYSKWILRLTTQALTDLNIDNRQLYIIEGGVQVGFSPFAPRDPNETTHSIRLNLLGDRFYFDFNSANMKPEAATYLRAMGAYLKKHLDSWETLLIEGHTDERGSDAYNLKLSKARAKAVMMAIAEGGAPKDRLGFEGFSFHRPRVNEKTPEAYRENRRVELKFGGISNKPEFTEGLEKLKKKP